MAVGPFRFTDAGYLAMRKNTIAPETDTIVGVLVDNAHTPDVTTEATYADIQAQVTDSGYTTAFPNGNVVTGLTWSQVSSRNFKLDGDYRDYGNTATISARYEYFVKRAGASIAGTDLILGYLDLNDGGSANVQAVSGNFDPDFNASGILTETLTP